MLSDCQRCWNTPCTCGWDYRDWSDESLNSLIATLVIVKIYKKNHPNAVFSEFGKPLTEDDKELLRRTGSYVDNRKDL